jgi:outer membrane protein assembly factor BamB
MNQSASSFCRLWLPPMSRWAAIALLAAAGCKSGDRAEEPSGGRGGLAANTGSSASPAITTEVEQRHVIGPAAASELNYRVAWQYVGPDRGVKVFTVQGDSAFLVDGRNFLTRIRDGSKIWRVDVAEPLDDIFAVNLIGDRVYVTTGGSMLVLDAATGTAIGKQRFEKVANTAPALFGGYLIYGSRNGQIIWHNYQVGYPWRGYQVATTIAIPPVISDGVLVAVGNDGTVVSLDARHATRYWSNKLLDAVVAAPAVGDAAVFVAGLDQYIRAFDLTSGRTLWKVLTESQLTESPVLVGDRVYQQVPSEGLVCFKAQPPDMPGGELIWKSPGVKGSVVLGRRDQLFVWDNAGQRISVLQAKDGGIVRTVDLPQVRRLLIAGSKNDEIYAASDDGRVVRVVPRN